MALDDKLVCIWKAMKNEMKKYSIVNVVCQIKRCV